MDRVQWNDFASDQELRYTESIDLLVFVIRENKMKYCHWVHWFDEAVYFDKSCICFVDKDSDGFYVHYKSKFSQFFADSIAK